MLIQARNLGLTYAPRTPLERVALREVHLDIHPGERVGVLGPTGSGKSSLVQLLAGLLRPTTGAVLLDGVPAHARGAQAAARRSRIGLAFQYPERQIFEQTVFREVAFGPRQLRLDAAEVSRRVHWALENVGLDPETVAERVPFALSGGEMRRVALAGVLALQPEVLILDEPTAGLDCRGREELLGRILDWQARTGATLVMVSHDPDSLARAVRRVVVLADGCVVADGDARQVLSDTIRLRALGLDVPQPVAVLSALREAGWPVRVDRLLPEEAADEIWAARACVAGAAR
jgi:energy-coupling factor transport system ATP-binding protein